MMPFSNSGYARRFHSALAEAFRWAGQVGSFGGKVPEEVTPPLTTCSLTGLGLRPLDKRIARLGRNWSAVHQVRPHPAPLQGHVREQPPRTETRILPSLPAGRCRPSVGRAGEHFGIVGYLLVSIGDNNDNRITPDRPSATMVGVPVIVVIDVIGGGTLFRVTSMGRVDVAPSFGLFHFAGLCHLEEKLPDVVAW